MRNLWFDEFAPRLPRALLNQSAHLFVQLEPVLFEVLVKVLRAKHLRDLDQLVAVVVAHEEGLFAEDLV